MSGDAQPFLPSPDTGLALPPFVAAAGSSNTLTALPADEKILYDIAAKLAKESERIETSGLETVVTDATRFFGLVQMLSCLRTVPDAQPGYPKGDRYAQNKRDRMRPLFAKVDELKQKVANACPLTDPVDVLAPDVLQRRHAAAIEIFNCLHAPENVAAIKRFAENDSVDAKYRRATLDSLGIRIGLALEQASKTSKAEEVATLLKDVINTNDHATIVGVLVVSTGVLSTSIGNLPGPSSLHLAVLRLRGMHLVAKYANDAKQLRENFDALLAQLPKALNLRAEDVDGLKTITAQLSPAPGTTLSPADLKKINKEAKAFLDERFNGAHASVGMSWAASLFNCLAFAGFLYSGRDLSDSDFQRMLDGTYSAAVTVNGVVASIARTPVLEAKCSMKLIRALLDVAESKGAQTALCAFGGVVAIIDGGCTFVDALKKKDYWSATIGGLQVASGALILLGAATSCAWAGPVGAILGVAALVCAAAMLVRDAVRDSMQSVLLQLIAQLRAAKVSYTGKEIAKTLGVDGLLAELESAASDDAVEVIGIPGAEYPEAACRAVKTELVAANFSREIADKLVVWDKPAAAPMWATPM